MKITRCDVALALAPLRRRPGTAAILVILIAAACALSTVNLSTFLFLYARPLPFTNYERVAYLGQASGVQRSAAGDPQTLDNFLFLQTELGSAERVAAYSAWRNETLRHRDTSVTVTGCWITPGFLEILGVNPALGISFSDAAAIHQSPRPLILSDTLWTQRFQRDPAIVGQTVYLNDRLHVIVGVMGAGFEMPGFFGEDQPAYWAPLNPDDIPKADWKSRWFPTIALLKPGVSLEQLNAELALVTPRLRQLHPTVMAERSLVAHDLKQWLLGDVRRYFNLLVVVAALLSVIVVVNLINLLLGQLADRQAYMVTARALGADQIQMLTPLLLEFLVLAVIGGVVGVPLALAYRHVLVEMLGRAGLALPTFEPALYGAVGTAISLLVVTSVVLGVRILQRQQSGGGQRLVASTRTIIGGSRGLVDGIAVLGQTALAITLLVVCTLLALGLKRQASANAELPLMKLQRAFLVMRLDKYPTQEARIQRLFELKEALRALPELEGAALANPAMPGEGSPKYRMIDDRDTVAAKDSVKYIMRPAVCPDYFKLAGLKVVSGRTFSEQDMVTKRRLLVVSRRAVELHWSGQDPVGRRVFIDHRTDDWAEVIGVVDNIESAETNLDLPLMWRAFNYHPFNIAELLFNTRTGAPINRQRFETILNQVDPDIILGECGTITQLQERRRWMPEAIARLSLLLAVVASVVCAFGIFSVLNRRVEASSKDIAVRKALGASAWHVITSVGKRDFLWAVGGVLIGVILSLVAGRHFFEVTNLRAVEVVAAPLIGASGVLLAAVMGATVPIARALAASTASLLRGE